MLFPSKELSKLPQGDINTKLATANLSHTNIGLMSMIYKWHKTRNYDSVNSMSKLIQVVNYKTYSIVIVKSAGLAHDKMWTGLNFKAMYQRQTLGANLIIYLED